MCFCLLSVLPLVCIRNTPIRSESSYTEVIEWFTSGFHIFCALQLFGFLACERHNRAVHRKQCFCLLQPESQSSAVCACVLACACMRACMCFHAVYHTQGGKQDRSSHGKWSEEKRWKKKKIATTWHHFANLKKNIIPRSLLSQARLHIMWPRLLLDMWFDLGHLLNYLQT